MGKMVIGMMKRGILLIVLIIGFSQWVRSSDYPSFRVSPPVVNEKNGKYLVEFSVAFQGDPLLFQGTDVLVTSERLVIVGEVTENRITERDFLYAALDYDLNNDGDFDDVYSVSAVEGGVHFDDVMVIPVLASRRTYQMNVFDYMGQAEKWRVFQMGKRGHPFLLYQYAQRMTVGLSFQKVHVIIERFPNPSVQVMVLQAQEKRFAKPDCLIRGIKNYLTFTNEQFFDDQAGRWVSIVWGIADLPKYEKGMVPLSFMIEGIKPPFKVGVAVNCSVVKGIRMQTVPSFRLVRNTHREGR